MIPYDQADYNLQSLPIFMKQHCYDDNIYTFDIETTSIFLHGDCMHAFDSSKPAAYYSECEKLGYMYIWQFSVNDMVVYGRTWEQFIELITALRAQVLGDMIIYVHNLAFESQFLRNVISDFEIFARAPRHAIVARSAALGVEFRCSLVLTNAALANVPHMYNLPVEKMTGDLDYNLIRTSDTIMSAKELKYCEHDCLVVYELIRKLQAEYMHVCKIPLTQTGRLRRKCEKMYHGDIKYKRHLQQQIPATIDDLTFALKAFSGGYTHANAFYTGEILHHVHSRDITSSYPTVMIAEQYPITQFYPTHASRLQDLDHRYCWLVDITFYNIESTRDNTYLSISKSLERYHFVGDNGRMVQADSVRYILTDVDIDIIAQCYRWESCEIHEARRAEKGYLNKKFINQILQLYSQKTQYKGLPDYANEYMQSKQYINAMYGMMVTNLITDQVVYDERGWSVHALTHEEAQEKLDHIRKSPRTFLNQCWGVYVTAYARRNLWSMILKLDHDVIYCDTDSVKYMHDHDADFDAYNKDVQKKLQDACRYHGLDADMLNPADPKGNHHPLGIFDAEPDYHSFITLGAKKYAFQHDAGGKIEITLAGVSKHGASALHSLKDFRQGFTFDYDHAGKKILTYNDEQPCITVTDHQGHSTEVRQPYGINLMPTEYTIGLSSEYESYINDTLHYSGGGF